MKNVSVVGIDIAKRIFHLYGADSKGHKVMSKKVYRDEFLEAVAQLPKEAVVVMEACGGAHYWGRRFQGLGFEVRLIAPQFVKPYVKGNKTDMADAEAISEAALRPTMRYVRVKSITEQELQHLHRARELAIKSQTAEGNSIRGMLLEYGISLVQGKKGISEVSVQLEKYPERMSPVGRELIMRAVDRYKKSEEEVEWYDKKIEGIAKVHPVCKRLQTVPGIGPIISTALVAAVGDPSAFKNGRQFSAWLGIVPKQHSTGGKQKLLGISKRGDKYLRKQLIHGSRSLLYRAHLKTDTFSIWATNLKERRGWNRTTVAIANKTARICWSILRFENDYQSTRAARV